MRVGSSTAARPILLLIVLSFGASPAYAKRGAPPDVPPIAVNGIEYSAPHWGRTSGKQQNGGYIEARDLKTGKLLWELRIYEIKYDPELETDVQDVFITSMQLADGKVYVANEAGDKFVVDLSQRKVIKSPRTFFSVMSCLVVAAGLLVVLWRFRRAMRWVHGSAEAVFSAGDAE
jgi:outer membrane protein assembly factor BamB